LYPVIRGIERRVKRPARPGGLLWTLGLALLVGGCAHEPDPATPEEISARVEGDLGRLFAGQAPLVAPLSLPEAMARAVLYNQESRLRVLETTSAEHVAELAGYALLPEISAEESYLKRNPENISSADSLRRWRHDLTLTWNFLDFGVSWLSGKQQADRVLIAEERRRKAVQGIVQDVRRTYWLALCADSLATAVPAAERRSREALAITDASGATGPDALASPLAMLETQKTVLTTLRQLKALEQRALAARNELAALVNLVPGQQLGLPAPAPALAALGDIDPGRLPAAGALERFALQSRPELREEDYQARISADETTKAILRLLPGLEFTTGADNAYNNAFTWSQVGLRMSAKLLDLITGPANIALAETQEELGQIRRLALNMSVLTQVHLALDQLRLAQEELAIARRVLKVSDRQWRHAAAELQEGRISRLQLLRYEQERVLALAQRDLAAADVQAALGTLQASLGLDPLPPLLPGADMATLSGEIGRRLQEWDRTLLSGQMPAQPPVPVPVAVEPPACTTC